jgi:2-dehydro-3-deoxygluconokinase
MARVITFGEIMLRLAPPGFQRFFQSPVLEALFGGGEANVAVGLSFLGIPAAFVTKLPSNAVGDAAVGELRRYGVDTSMITRGGNRVGIYYCEKGSSQRASKVIYDRAHSAIAEATIADFKWDEIFKDAEWFHFTGITPALGDSAAALCLAACRKAKEKGLTVSCDLNYRKNLWPTERAGKVMSGLMQYIDLLIANEEDSEKVFGIKADNSDVAGGTISHDGYTGVAKKLVEKFGFKKVAITLRTSRSASDNGWAGMYYENGKSFFSREYDIHIVDRVGGGDSFGAGLIYSFLKEMNAQEAIDFAVAASCLKHSIEGDFNLATLDEVKALVRGDASGRVQR